MEAVKQAKRRLPTWWGDAKKMEALLRARRQYPSDRATARAVGISRQSERHLYNVLAWGRGEWAGPESATEAERALAESFAVLWLMAREAAPKAAPRKRKPLADASAKAILARLEAVGSEWDPSRDQPF